MYILTYKYYIASSHKYMP